MIDPYSGHTIVALGGDQVYKSFSNHGIVVELTWNEGKPVMLLYRQGVAASRQGALMIELNDAHRYADPNGGPTPSLVADCVMACESIGLRADRHNAKLLADAILEHIEDLIIMPPAPKAPTRAGPAIGEVEITIDGKTVVEDVVRA